MRGHYYWENRGDCDSQELNTPKLQSLNTPDNITRLMEEKACRNCMDTKLFRLTPTWTHFIKFVPQVTAE